MSSTLQLGTAKVDITPQRRLPLAGFAHRTGDFEKVLRQLFLRIFLFQQRDELGAEQRALIVSADLLCWGPDQIPRLQRQLQEKFDLEEGSIILHATHNHSGPQTSGLFPSSLGKCDPEYVASLESLLIRGIETARESLEPVSIERGFGSCSIGIHRRRSVAPGDTRLEEWEKRGSIGIRRGETVAGRIIMAPNPEGPVDPEVTVIRFATQTGPTKALLVHYTCHATTSGENVVSSEFPGVAMEHLEKSLGGGTVAAYLQGCCGDVRPALIRGDVFYRGSDCEVQDLGRHLAEEALSVISRPLGPCTPGSVKWKNARVWLPLQALPSFSELDVRCREPGIVGEWARLLLDQPQRLQPHIPLQVTRLDMAPNLSLLAFNAEMVVDYGLFVKRRFPKRALPVAYSNGMIGYVPTAAQLAEGGYEPNESFYYYGLPAPFAFAVQGQIHDSVNHIMAPFGSG